ncbi:MAG: PqqD family protein [Vicinamibacterales bacterium]
MRKPRAASAETRAGSTADGSGAPAAAGGMAEVPETEPLDPDSVVFLTSDVIIRRLGDGFVLVNLATDRIYDANLTAGRILELLAGGTTVGALQNTLLDEFEVDEATLVEETSELLCLLSSEGLLRAGRPDR